VQTIIRNATIVNENSRFVADVWIKNERIERIDQHISVNHGVNEINAEGLMLFPGVIDDQVHFRQPGLTYKGDLFSESRAAVAGGITSFMEMPNTIPNTLTQELLQEKYNLAQQHSWANYSFFMGASNDNLEEVLKTNRKNVCGIKIFMGSSTGNMLVDNLHTLENIFSKSDLLIAVHCEDERLIRHNAAQFRQKYGEAVTIQMHPLIRSAEACFHSSSLAVELAKKHNTRLHILHISTANELSLFDNSIPLKQKRITAEACIHHLWFDETDYERLGNFIKWNPAIKSPADREAILKGVLDNSIDIIATDHAPHTIEEKQQPYLSAPSGGPLVQHALVAMLEMHKQKKITLEKIVEKMCHAPAECFRVVDRGYIREGYFADLVLVDLHDVWTVTKENVLYKCQWSPFEGQQFNAKVYHTFVNGFHVYKNGKFQFPNCGMRLQFSN
jgi:dihydroorotase